MHSGNHFSQLEPTRARRDPPIEYFKRGVPSLTGTAEPHFAVPNAQAYKAKEAR